MANRPRARSEGTLTDHGTCWVLSEAFERYQNVGQVQTRFLGLCCLKLGACCWFPNTAFYQVSLDNSLLPPKKRKKRKSVVQYDVVFCLKQQYYRFPRDAVVEAVNDTSPFEVLFSYHLPRKAASSSRLHSICLCSCRDEPSDGHVLNMQISGVSQELYMAIKYSVSDFEAICQRMMELMRLHAERVQCEREPRQQRAKDENKTVYVQEAWSSDENVSWSSSSSKERSSKQRHVVAKKGVGKKCLYCGSKSTPMWRRGPQGAGTLCNACGVKWKHGKILCGTDTATVRKVEKKKRRRRRKAVKRVNDDDDDDYSDQVVSLNAAARWDSSLSYDDIKSSSSLSSFEKLTMSVDAVEAAAVLTLLKRS